MQVIIADSDCLLRQVLKHRCREWGFEVLLAADGIQAEELFINQDTSRIFLLAGEMPGLSGIDLCAKIRNSNQVSYSYIVIISAHNNAGNLIQAFEAGADDYMVKPFNINELCCRLNVGKRILELQDNILQMANVDYLTGLYNRRYFYQRMECELSRCRREKRPVGILLLDIDNFKAVNDNYGHVVGDHVLTRLAGVLHHCCRDYDLIGRFGGEEFIVCLPGANQDETFAIAERIRQQIAEETFNCTANTSFTITASIGCVSAYDGEPEALIIAADKDLYAAKRAGKNRSVRDILSLTQAEAQL